MDNNDIKIIAHIFLTAHDAAVRIAQSDEAQGWLEDLADVLKPDLKFMARYGILPPAVEDEAVEDELTQPGGFVGEEE